MRGIARIVGGTPGLFVGQFGQAVFPRRVGLRVVRVPATNARAIFIHGASFLGDSAAMPKGIPQLHMVWDVVKALSVFSFLPASSLVGGKPGEHVWVFLFCSSPADRLPIGQDERNPSRVDFFTKASRLVPGVVRIVLQQAVQRRPSTVQDPKAALREIGRGR